MTTEGRPVVGEEHLISGHWSPRAQLNISYLTLQNFLLWMHTSRGTRANSNRREPAIMANASHIPLEGQQKRIVGTSSTTHQEDDKHVAESHYLCREVLYSKNRFSLILSWHKQAQMRLEYTVRLWTSHHQSLITPLAGHRLQLVMIMQLLYVKSFTINGPITLCF